MAASQQSQLGVHMDLPLRGPENDLTQAKLLTGDSHRLGFLDLPAEIREQIYQHLFNDASYYPCSSPGFVPKYYERYHAYPTVRLLPPSNLPHVWKDNAAVTKLHWQLPPFWRSHRLPPDVVRKGRLLHQISKGYTWPKRQYRLNLNGLLFTSRVVYADACRQYHQHARLTCRSPLELFDLTHRTHECGTSAQVESLTLMIELHDLFSRWPWYRDDPECAGDDFVENARIDRKLRHDWIGLLAVAQPNFITAAFPNLKTLEINFAYRLHQIGDDEYQYHCIHEDHKERFVEFMTEHFAPKIFGQEQLNVYSHYDADAYHRDDPCYYQGFIVGGVKGNIGFWIHQGVTGIWEPFESVYQTEADEGVLVNPPRNWRFGDSW